MVEEVDPAAVPVVLSIDVGRKNLALCAVRPGDKPASDRIVAWSVISCEPTAAGIAAAVHALTRDDARWADATARCTDVVIERQPPRNATMSRLQHYLEMYFAMHSKHVVVQDAKHKLAYAASTPWWPSGDLASWTYYLRKKLSVQTTEAFLADTHQAADLVDAFQQTKKKDDYADSLLQCQAYCHLKRASPGTLLRTPLSTLPSSAPDVVPKKKKARRAPPPPRLAAPPPVTLLE